jgi:murein DD-endopeptidase MepM/ murein hydrolase activator NlpD
MRNCNAHEKMISLNVISKWISASAIVALALLPLSMVSAQTRVDELKQNISTREDDIKKLESEIVEYHNRLQSVGTQKKTLQSALQTLDLTRAKLGKDIQLTQKKIERTNTTITDLNKNIDQQESRIERNKQVIASSMFKIAQADEGTLLEVLLGYGNLSSFFQEIDDLTRMQAAIRDNIQSLQQLKVSLGEQRNAFQVEQKNLVRLNTQHGDQKNIADQQKKEQTNLLAVTKNQESNYKKLLAQKEAAKKQFEREVEDFEAALRAEIDQNSFPKPGTKVLAYPLDGVFVTQYFGKSVDALRLYVSGTHNGMDFRASPGTQIKSAADGIVIGTGDTDKVCRGASYGRWVMVRHKNGLSSLYAHLELIKVSEGQSVQVGELLGYSGNTGYSTGPHLHFGLFVANAVNIQDFPSKSCAKAIFRIPVAAHNAYLDPQAYL